MEAAVSHCHHFLSGILPDTSPLANHQLLPPPNRQNAPTRVGLVMKNLSLTRISANIISINCSRFQDPKFFSSLMATKNNNQPHESTTENIKEKEEVEEKKLPPPPEKPEPGDCCGSGCVRCVWDMYYEELEAYNKLYKTDSNVSKSLPS